MDNATSRASTSSAAASSSFADWSEVWLRTSLHLKPKSVAGYRSLLVTHLLPAFGSLPLEDIDGLAVRMWVADLAAGGLSSSRVRQAFYTLSGAMRLAVDLGVIGRNPCAGVKLPRMIPKERTFLTADEVHRLAEAIGPRYGPLVYTMSYGALRWGEACGLRWACVDPDGGKLTIRETLVEIAGRLSFGTPKGHRERAVRIPRFLCALLAAGRPEDPAALVFSSASGLPLRHGNFARDHWRPAVARAGLSSAVTPHVLRHTAVALLVSAGANPKLVQRQLGHTKISMTLDGYGHVFPDDLDSVAAALDRVAHHAKR